MKQVIFDVETKKTFEAVGGYYPEKLGVSFVGVIEREGFPEEGEGKENRYELFEKDLDRLWPIFEGADVIVGFNSNGFDLPALQPYYNGDMSSLPSLDILAVIKEQVGHRLSLDAVASQTLGIAKSGNGLDAIEFFERQKWDLLASYCMKDVEITREVYDYGRVNRKLKYINKWNNVMEVEVDFSFTPEDNAGLQLTLV